MRGLLVVPKHFHIQLKWLQCISSVDAQSLCNTNYMQEQLKACISRYIYLGLKNISRVVYFVPSLLLWRRHWHRRAACTKSSASSVQKSRIFSSSILHASIISLRDGGTLRDRHHQNRSRSLQCHLLPSPPSLVPSPRSQDLHLQTH